MFEKMYKLLSTLDTLFISEVAPMRTSKWYPEVRRPTVLPDITRVRSSIDNRNPGYQPSHRWVEMVCVVVSSKEN